MLTAVLSLQWLPYNLQPSEFVFLPFDIAQSKKFNCSSARSELIRRLTIKSANSFRIRLGHNPEQRR